MDESKMTWAELGNLLEREDELRSDMLEALTGLGVDLRHYELTLERHTFWRIGSRCGSNKWRTAKLEPGTEAAAQRLSKIGKCGNLCDTRQVPVFLPRTMRQIDRGSGLRSVSRRTRQSVIARDGLICGICGRDVAPEDVHIDHVTPVVRGGDSHPLNLQVTHRACNMRKGTRLWEELADREQSASEVGDFEIR